MPRKKKARRIVGGNFRESMRKRYSSGQRTEKARQILEKIVHEHMEAFTLAVDPTQRKLHAGTFARVQAALDLLPDYSKNHEWRSDPPPEDSVFAAREPVEGQLRELAKWYGCRGRQPWRNLRTADRDSRIYIQQIGTSLYRMWVADPHKDDQVKLRQRHPAMAASASKCE